MLCKEHFLKSTTRILRVVPTVLTLSAGGWSVAVYAQATPAEKTAATESIGTAAKKTAKAATEAGGKTGAAVTRTGEKIGEAG